MRFLKAAAALAAAALATALFSCAARPAAKDGFTFRTDAPVVLVATSSGLRAPRPGQLPIELAGAVAPAALAPNADVVSANANMALVAVNRIGIALLVPSADGSSFTLANRPAPEHFARRTAAAAWPRGEGFLVHLYRDPFAAEGGTEALSSALLALDGHGTARLVLGPGAGDTGSTGAPAFQLFALFPVPDGTWLAQLRRDGASKVEQRYLRSTVPGGPGSQDSDIGRGEFERSLEPRPIAQAARLGSGAAALAPTLALAAGGSYLARVRSDRGSDSWFFAGDRAEEAPGATAWISGEGSVIAITASGRGASSRDGAPVAFSLEPPVKGASFVAITAVGRFAVASWDAGDFPFVSCSGVVVFTAP